MKDIVIIGTGGLATEIKYLIDAINKKELQWNLLGFIENWGKQKGDDVVDGYKIVGTTDDLNQMNKEIYVAIGVGFPERIKEIAGLVSNPHAKFPNLIHPSAEVSTTVLGEGNIICFGTLISCRVKIGSFNLFNFKSLVGHDAQIGSFNVLNPDAKISGVVTVGDGNLFGMNSSVFQGMKIGHNNKIGAYSFITRNINDEESLFGIPAKKM